MELRRKSDAAGQFLEFGDRIFVRVLGVYGLAGPKAKNMAAYGHTLFTHADEMHLDTAERVIVKSPVSECGEVEIGAEFPIDARKQVEIELGGDALRVVVRRVKHRR